MADDPTIPASSAPPVQTRVQRLLAYRVLVGLVLGVFALDQLSKSWIAAHLIYTGTQHLHGGGFHRVVVRDFFYLIHVGNTGAAWSMFTGRSVMLAVLAAGTLAAIYFWRHTLGLRGRQTQVSFGLLCGGILGNLTDRLVHGYVIDFIDLHFGTYVYPTFNVADSAICVGVVLYLWQSLRAPNP